MLECLPTLDYEADNLPSHFKILGEVFREWLRNHLLVEICQSPPIYSTHSMQQSPSWETDRFSTSQEIPYILEPKVHYHIHKCLPPLPILSHIDPVHALTSHLLKIHFNIILPSMPGSSKWFLSSDFPTMLTCYMPCPPHSWFNHLNNTGWGVQIIKLLIPLRPKYSPQRSPAPCFNQYLVICVGTIYRWLSDLEQYVIDVFSNFCNTFWTVLLCKQRCEKYFQVAGGTWKLINFVESDLHI